LGPYRAGPNLNGSCWAGPNLIYSSWVQLRSQTQSQNILKKIQKNKNYEFEVKKTIKKNSKFFSKHFSNAKKNMI
jgi:hypothetical protein